MLSAAEARFEYSVPVVVIGAGACGLTAALAAREAGAEALVLERDAKPAGSTALSIRQSTVVAKGSVISISAPRSGSGNESRTRNQ